MATWIIACVGWGLTIFGHLGLWAWLFNRTHATACPRFYRKLIEKFILLVVFGPLAWGIAAWAVPDKWNVWGDLQGIDGLRLDFTRMSVVGTAPHTPGSRIGEPAFAAPGMETGSPPGQATSLNSTSVDATTGRSTAGKSLATKASWGSVTGVGLITQVYVYSCWLAAVVLAITWLHRKFTFRPSSRVRVVRRELEDVAARLQSTAADQVAETTNTASPSHLLHGWFPRLLGQVPFNQITQISWEWYRLKIGPLWRQLQGLKICHLSDFHWTGQIDRRYYEYLFDRVNQESPDLIFLTGDIVDETECLDWIEPLIGSLQAKYGVYYILGNHDLRIPREADIRERMARAGALAAAGEWIGLAVNGQQLWITGNELPWFKATIGVGQMPPAPEGLKILLSHSPDQLDWALRCGIDLMFAGHLHGGQICFPVIGPTISPSKYGARYASGFFDLNEMLMIVSRGVSGDEAIRILCPPQVSYFELVADD